MKNRHLLLMLVSMIVTGNMLGSDSASSSSSSFTLPTILKYSKPQELESWPQEQELTPLTAKHDASNQELSISDDELTVKVKDTRTQQTLHTLVQGRWGWFFGYHKNTFFTKAYFNEDASHAMLEKRFASYPDSEPRAHAQFLAFDTKTGNTVWESPYMEVGYLYEYAGKNRREQKGLDARFMSTGKIVTKYPSNHTSRPIVRSYDPADHNFSQTTPAQQELIEAIHSKYKPGSPVSLYNASNDIFTANEMRLSLAQDFSHAQQAAIVRTYEISDHTKPGCKEKFCNLPHTLCGGLINLFKASDKKVFEVARDIAPSAKPHTTQTLPHHEKSSDFAPTLKFRSSSNNAADKLALAPQKFSSSSNYADDDAAAAQLPPRDENEMD